MPVFSPPSQNVDANFTVGYLIDRTFDLLLGAGREELSQLVSGIDNQVTQFNVAFPPAGLSQGTYMAIDDEVMYIWDFSAGSGTSSVVVVQRGVKGTAAVSHAANAIIQVNPPFAKVHVRRSLQDEIRSWGPQVFAVNTTEIPAVEFVRGYDLGAISPFFFVLEVRESPITTNGVVSSGEWRLLDFDVQQMADSTAFPSGQALTITDPNGIFDLPRTLQVTYGAPFNVDSSFLDNDNLISMGMDTSDVDIAPYGVAWRMASAREMRRALVEGQGQVGDLQNFPPGYQLKAAEEFKALRDSRLLDAEMRLRARFPIRRHA